MDIKRAIVIVEAAVLNDVLVVREAVQTLKTAVLAQQTTNKQSTPCQYHEWLRVGKQHTGFMWCPYCRKAL